MENTDLNKSVLWTSDFVLASIANFLMGLSFYLLMPTLPFFIVERFHSSPSLIGIIVSCYVIAALVIRPFSGYLVDSFSRKLVYLISFAFFVAFYFGYLVAGSVLFLMLLRFMHGLSWGIITTAGNTLAIDIMPADKRGQGIGIYGLALNISMALGPVLGIFLYQHYSFNALFYTAIVSGTIGLFCAAGITSHPKPKINHAPLSLDRFIMLKAIPIGINLLLITISYGMILSFAAMYGKEVNANNPGLFFIFLALGIISSRLFSGRLIDGGRLNQMAMVGISILAISFIAFALLKTPVVYYSSALAMGLGYGMTFPAFQTIFINMATHAQRGTANSTFFTAFDIGVGIGMLVAGKIAALVNLSAAFAFSALACMVAVVFYWKVSKANYAKNKL